MTRRVYQITEHHVDFRLHGPGRAFQVPVGSTTCKQGAIDLLVGRRSAGDMPPTLSYWSVGGTLVHAQGTHKLMDRQGLGVPKE